MSRVLAALVERARATPDAVVLSSPSLAFTGAELIAEINRTTRWIGEVTRGTPERSPVAVVAPNACAWVVLDLALIQMGRPSVPIPAFFTPDQRRHALRNAGAQVVISAAPDLGDGFDIAGLGVSAERTAYPAVELPEGTAKITYTSGSTGTPKGVCLSLTQMEDVSCSLVSMIGTDYAGIHAPVLPLSILLENVAGLYTTLLAGGCYHVVGAEALGLSDPFRPDLFRLADAVAAARATSLILVPELLRGLVMVMQASGQRLPTLKLLAVGGAKTPPALLAAAQALGLPVYEGYGLSECASVVALNTPGHNRPGSVGRPLPHLTLEVGADGEIVVGPRPFLGYAGGKICTGPVRTGDVGRLDGDGFVHVEGRRDNVIVTAFGRNVSPEWVESELLAQPEIRQAVVYGEAQPDLGALVVPVTQDLGAAGVGQAIARANQRLPEYARIRRWRIRGLFETGRGELTGNGRPRRGPLLAAMHELTEYTADHPPMTLYQRLVAETLEGQVALAGVPQLQDGLAGRISRETYIAYLTEAYHHVKHTVPLMQAARAGLDDRHDRFRRALDEYVAEETGHEAWILNDIRHCGGDPEAARRGQPRPATRRMVDYAYEFIRDRNPMGFFGMVFVLEGTSVRLATSGAGAVASSLGLGPQCFTYLTSHGALDQEHLGFFERLMDEVTEPEDQQAILTVAKAMFQLFADVFRSIPHERKLAHAI